MASTLGPSLTQEMLRGRDKKPGSIPQSSSSSVDRGTSLQTSADGPDVEATPFFKKYGFEAESLEDDDAIAAAKEMRPVRNEDQIENRAFELFREDSIRYPTLDAARARAEQELANDQAEFDEVLASGERKVNLQDKAVNDFRSQLSTKLQAAGPASFASIPGEFQDRIENEMVRAVRNGQSPKKAAAEATSKALSFAKTRNNVLSASPVPVIGQGSGKWYENINSARKNYDKVGALELYKDDLINKQGLTDQTASYQAYPTSQSLNKDLARLKNNEAPFAKFVPKSMRNKIPLAENLQTASDKQVLGFVDNLIKNQSIGPDDSIQSLQMQLRLKGYEDKNFISEIQRAYNDGSLSLNDRQARELESTSRIQLSVKDMYYWSQRG